MMWFFFSLLFAFFGAITMLINQKYKLEGHLISGMRGVGVAALYLPLAFFVEFPTNPIFWGLIIFEAFISTFFNARLYESSARYGADSTSLISVLSIAFGMILWWIWDWERFLELCENPFVMSGIVLSLCAVSFGFYKMAMKSGSFQKGELSYMMPAVVVLSVMMINRKWVMEEAEFYAAAVYYCVVAIFLSGAANLAIYAKNSGGIFSTGWKKLKSELSQKTILKAGLFMALASGATIFCGNAASYFVPNPAYVNAITLTSPIWIVLVNRAYGIRSKISPVGTAIMLVGLFLLIYFADISLHSSPYDK